MTEPTEPGAQPKDDEQKEGGAASTSSTPEHQTQSSNASVQQEGPVSDAGPAAGEGGNPGNDIWAEISRHADEAMRYQPQGDKPVVAAPDLLRRREVRNNTDKALANKFRERYGHLFCNGGGATHVYLPRLGRWTQNKVPEKQLAYGMHLSDHLYDELAEVRAELATARAEGREDAVGELSGRVTAITNLILHCEKKSTISNVQALFNATLNTLLEENRVVMDHDPDLLACGNGVLNLRTLALRQPRPEDYITRHTDVVYKFDADTFPLYAEWVQTVRAAFDGDEALYDYVHRAIGYSATGHTREQCMFVLWGGGSNGKNLLMDPVRRALGTHARTISTKVFDAETKDSQVDYEKAAMSGVRLGVSSEFKERVAINESFVKGVTGDDTITARHIYGSPFEFKPLVKLFLLTNPRPEVRGTDDGIWRRLRLIPFTVKFGDADEVNAGVAQQLKDTGLLDKFTSEAGLEVVLRWIAEGARKYLTDGGLRTPKKVIEATNNYRREEDFLGLFLTECLEYISKERIDEMKTREAEGLDKVSKAAAAKGEDEPERLYVPKDELFQAYEEWCEENGHGKISASRFKVRILATKRFAYGPKAEAEVAMPPLESYRTEGTDKRTPVYRYCKLNERGLELAKQAKTRRDRKF
jgi:P4 family phage/plasmid primase-like protien